jgi:hypothetical protein
MKSDHIPLNRLNRVELDRLPSVCHQKVRAFRGNGNNPLHGIFKKENEYQRHNTHKSLFQGMTNIL